MSARVVHGAPFAVLAALGAAVACGQTDTAQPLVDASTIDSSTGEPDTSTAPDSSLPDVQPFSEAGADAASIAAPRLISPTTTATVSKQSPTITWALPQGVEGGHVEVCKDRDCKVLETSFDAPGTSGAPSTALSPGMHFFRVAGRVGNTVGIDRSATWELFVGHRSAPLDTSYGAVPDFNGDGLSDVIAAGGSAFVDVFPGNKLGPSDATVAHIADPSHQASDNFPRAAFGDVDGDGFTDLVVGNITTTQADQTNRISVYRGGPSGVDAKPAWVLHVPTPPADGGVSAYSLFAGSVTVPGDVNGDGYADILASSLNSGSVNGPTFVFYGHAKGPSTTPDAELHGENVAYYFYPAGPIGDVNGDGYADVLCTTQAAWGSWLFLGGPNGPSDSTRHAITAPAAAYAADFGRVITGAGDLDGDGLPDFAISAVGAVRANGGNGPYGPGQVYVYRGDSGPGLFTSDWTLTGPDGDGGQFGAAGAITGDLDADGYDDLEVGAYAVANNAGRGYYFRGGPSGVSDSARVTIVGNGGYFGNGAQAGDLNGDGVADALISQPVWGVINVFYGGPKGISDGTTKTTLGSAAFIYILAERASDGSIGRHG